MGYVLGDLGDLTLVLSSQNGFNGVCAYDPGSGQFQGVLASFPAYYSAEFLNQNALASWENLPLTTIYVGANGEPSAIFSVIYGYGAQATVTPLISSTGTGGYGAVSDNGVACDANYLYVLTWNHTIYRYDHRGNPAGIGQDPSTGVFVPVGAGGLGTASPSNYETQGMAIGPDGNLYVVDGNSVLSFSSASGAFLTSFVACPPSAGDPMTIVFDALGDMYVLGDIDGASWVLKFNGTSGQPKGTNGNTSDATLVAAGASGLSTFGGMCVAANLETGASTVYVTSVFGINMGGGQGGDIGGGEVMTFDGVSGQFIGILVPNRSGGVTQPRSMILTHTFTPSNPYPIGPDSGSDASGSRLWRRVVAWIIKFLKFWDA